MTVKLLCAALILAIAGIFSAWRLSRPDETSIVIVDHDVKGQILSCGRPEVSVSNGLYSVHVHDSYGGEMMLSGKSVTISKQVTDSDRQRCAAMKRN